ncbi:MAG: AraC family transcriptional regulator [Olsenella sp.]|jgi:AraC-like DNA-binding protein|nr:AraC family transcriptional regulator [Olsenella sp.]MCI2127581.1 AraC family transcriptional regulator [Olsenella sp.]
MDLDGLDYLATSLASISVVPVHVYQGEKLAAAHIPVRLPADPLALFEQDALALAGPVGYLPVSDNLYIGVVRAGDARLVVGPVPEAPLPPSQITQMAAQLGVSPADLPQFLEGMQSLTPLPLLTTIQVLCAVAFAATGEKVEPDQVLVHDDAQRTLDSNFAEDEFRAVEFADDKSLGNSSLKVEGMLCDLVRQGRPDELRAYFSALPSFRAGVLSPNRLRNAKDTFVASVTVVSRAAIAGGMDADEALSLSDSYINRCELAVDTQQVSELGYHMAVEYAERVGRLRLGEDPSALVLSVTNYVRGHIYEPLRTEDVAQALFVSRGFLSTRFKQETGMGLADFIRREKVAEAKSLLRNTEQSILDISTYLGFCSQSHFNAVFKRETGMTPREWRLQG